MQKELNNDDWGYTGGLLDSFNWLLLHVFSQTYPVVSLQTKYKGFFPIICNFYAISSF